jgi:hypothetical protein
MMLLSRLRDQVYPVHKGTGLPPVSPFQQ